MNQLPQAAFVLFVVVSGALIVADMVKGYTNQVTGSIVETLERTTVNN